MTDDVEEQRLLSSRQQALLAWFEGSQRDLPWRRTRDPWAVLVSETMLQQTQVSRVLPKYLAFLGRFPDVATCAVAPAGDVVRMWAGLGYNRRALQLHRAAIAVVDHHGGVVPITLPELLTLPGVGPYTARAVLAFAREQDVGVLDTNASRVLARAFAGRRLGGKEAQELADAVVPAAQGWAWNQAVLDLGATVCRKHSPDCGACPLATSCAWRRAVENEVAEPGSARAGSLDDLGADGGPVVDPAIGSAGVSGRQSTFVGSDRQGRGRLIDALRLGPVHIGDLAERMGWPDDEARALRVVAGLVSDGLVVRDDELFRLP